MPPLEDLKKSKLIKYIVFFATVVIPLVTLMATTAMWVDTRYMHREISDTRFIDLQIQILEMSIVEYENKINNELPVTMDETRRYNLNVDQMKNLMKERTNTLGIGS